VNDARAPERTTPAPAGPHGPAGAGPSRRGRRSGALTHPLTWAALIGLLWGLPLLKSLRATYPEPPAGFDRPAEAFELVDSEGREVALADLAGFLLVVQPLDLADPGGAAAAFDGFRARKKRLRGLGPLVHHLLLVRGGSAEELSRFLDERTARKPSNLFLLDPGGGVWERLAAPGPGAPVPTVESPTHLVLDRRGRLRGSFDGGEASAADLSRLLTLLANWEGCDPPLGEPVHF